MLRSMRVRLMLAFVAVIAVAVGIAEVIAERTATHEFDSYVTRVDAAYLETLAQELGDYYAEHGSWQGVDALFLTLPQAPGHLQLQSSDGAIVADTSPGRGPGGGGGPGGSPGGPISTPRGPGPGGTARPDTPEAEATPTPGAGSGSPTQPAEAVSTPTPTPAGPDVAPNAGPSEPAESGGPANTSSTPQPGGPANTPSAPRSGGPAGTDASATPGAGPTSSSESGGPGGETAPGGEGPWGTEETGFGGETDVMVLANPASAAGSWLPVQATPTPQARQRIPIYANGQQVGTLVVLPQQGGLRLSASLSDRFFDRMRLALIVGGIAALMVAFLFALFFVDGITRPLRRLADAARRVAAGDFSHRVDVTSPSEAAALAGSFNQMAEALERDKEARHRLLADIAHELRTPLSVIQGTAEGFLDGVIAADEEHAAVIRDQSVILSKLITDLRDLSLAEAGELRLETVPTDLGELARQAATAAHDRAQERGIELEVAASSGVPPCLIDGARTLQVIGNLLDNALRHTPSGGRVTLRVREAESDTVVLEVEDTGEGIPAEHLPHIFERFYRVASSRARGGTGLGLAIVSQLATAQGGSVAVESEPGRGSLFRVSFPAATAGATDGRKSATRSRPAAARGGR